MTTKKQKTINLLIISVILSMVGILWGVYINRMIVFFGFINLLCFALILGLLTRINDKLNIIEVKNDKEKR